MSDTSFTTTNTGSPGRRGRALARPSAPTARSRCIDHYLIEKLAQFNRERVPERVVHAKGGGAFGRFETTEDVSRLHPRRAVPAGRDDRDARPLLHRRRRAGLPRHLARPARFRAEVLHVRGQLRPRRQQHPGVLHPRRHQVPRLHPLAEAPAGLEPARQRHAVGLLELVARERAPGHLAHGRPRPPGLLAAHGRLRLAHLPVDQRRRRAVLGQVPLQDRPGHRDPDADAGRRRSPARTPTSTAATCTRRSPTATSRAGRCRCRSCRTRTRRRTASTRSTSPRSGRTRTTR